MATEEDEQRHIEQSEKIAEHLELPDGLVPHVHDHLDELAEGRAPLIWIQGQNCTGCAVTLMNSEHFHPSEPGHIRVSMRYQPNFMAASGQLAVDQIGITEKAGKYLVVLEGAIPTGVSESFCTFGLTEATKDLMGTEVQGDRTVFDWLCELIPGAEAVVAVGNCASFGGIPAIEAEITGATSATDVVEAIDSTRPVVNVAGCPPHPDWVIGTIIDMLLWLDGHKKEPVLDEHKRIARFYEGKVHDVCERRKAFEEKRFLEDWNDCVENEDRCLLKLGCRGPKAHGDCPTRRWNSQVDWCVAANAPCHGCTEPDFYNNLPHLR